MSHRWGKLIVGLSLLHCVAGCSIAPEVQSSQNSNLPSTPEELAAYEAAIADLCEEAGTEAKIFDTVEGVEGLAIIPLQTFKNGLDEPATGQMPGGCTSECVDLLVSGYDFVETELLYSEADRARLDIALLPENIGMNCVGVSTRIAHGTIFFSGHALHDCALRECQCFNKPLMSIVS